MASLADLTYLDTDALRAAVPFTSAIAALVRAARMIEEDAMPRSAVDVSRGQFLLMPSEFSRYAGCKVLTVAPDNPRRGRERIQGLFLLFDGDTLEPLAVVDGAELTALRTPSVTAALVDLVTPAEAASLTVFGTGPQARRHIDAMRAIRPITHVRVVGRTAESSRRAAQEWSSLELEVHASTATAALDADIVICATTSSEPLFERDLDRRTTIAAVGSHEPDKRELPGRLLGRSQVVVESRTVAMTEAGDVMQAVQEGFLTEGDLLTFRDVAAGTVRLCTDRPRVVKTCGMGWQDLVVAITAIESTTDSTTKETHA